MGADTLHFGSNMLRIAGTSSIPTQDYLPLAAESGDQFASYLLDEMRHGGHLPDDCEMRLNGCRDRGLQVHTRPFHTMSA
jgi:hypothetical protein